MKRSLGETHATDTFFNLGESVEILLRNAPRAMLLASLLQLSKRTRKQAWDFLSDYEKWNAEWLAAFVCNLFLYRTRLRCPRAVVAQYPVFVLTKQSYMIAHFMTTEYLLIGSMYAYSDRPTDPAYPGWEIVKMPSLAGIPLIFDWYIVARALILAWDKRVLEHSLHCWHKDPVWSWDADLCLL